MNEQDEEEDDDPNQEPNFLLVACGIQRRETTKAKSPSSTFLEISTKSAGFEQKKCGVLEWLGEKERESESVCLLFCNG